MSSVNVYLFDGTYELCRAYFGAPLRKDREGNEIGAARSFMRNLYKFLTNTSKPYLACAFDHQIESFRNKLFAGYKTGEGMDPELQEQFPLVEEISRALGVVTWPMIEFEADDAIASAAHLYGAEKSVERVYLCSPDKDLAQCVVDDKVVLWDRLREKQYNREGVIEKFGVAPGSIADFLALTGDAADGVPGVPKWGAKSAATLLSHYQHLEGIPHDFESWLVKVRGARGLSESLNSHIDEAKLYKTLTTLRRDVPLNEKLADLEWTGVLQPEYDKLCERLEV